MTRVPLWLDLLAGMSFLLLGVVSATRSRRFATLAVLAGVAWFAGDVVAALLLVHRPLMLLTAVSYPDGRVRDRYAGAVLAASWLGALVQSVGLNAGFMLALGAGSIIEAGLLRWRSPIGWQASAVTASQAVFALAASLLVPAAARLWWPQAVENGHGLVIYTGLIAVAGLVLMFGLVLRTDGGDTDAVIELSEATPTETLAALNAERADEGNRSAKPALAAAAMLLEANIELQSTLARSVDDVRSSRSRLVEAAVLERQRLETIVSGGALRYLNELAATLHALDGMAGDNVRDLIAAGIAEVTHSRDDLEQLVRGLHPRVLTEHGLALALADVASRCPVPVDVRMEEDTRYPEPVESAVWYACTEAVTNLVKHAHAGQASITVTEGSGELLVQICDDGVGGARLAPGGGLAGLSDRLGAVDGSVAVTPIAGGGTRVRVRVPLR